MKIEKHIKNFDKGNFKYSIIIPTWNNLKYLQLLVESIRKNSKFRHQIIVHINEGKDGTLQWAKQQPDIDFTYSTQNIGICYALNICRSLMLTQYLVYANDDMYVCPNWDVAFDEEITKIGHNDFFLSNTLIEANDTGNLCVYLKSYGDGIEDFREEDLLREYDQLHKEDWTGSTWPINIVHIDNWDLVGGYSIEFSPGMYSDPDFSRKLWEIGVRYFKGLGKSKAYHFGSKSTRRIKANKGRDTFLLKWLLSSRTFTKQYIKRGEKFVGELAEKKPSLKEKFISKLKIIFAIIKK